MVLGGRNPVGYGWEMWEWQLLVGEIYIILYIYVGDINILYKFIVQNLPRGRDVPWRVSTLGIYIIIIYYGEYLVVYCKNTP